MITEYIFSFVIFSIVTLIMVGIGISQVKSKNPVGFYTGVEPPKGEQLRDVKLWNKKHGMMWIIYGVVILCSYFVGVLAREPILQVIIVCGVITCGLLLMVWYHNRLNKMFLK